MHKTDTFTGYDVFSDRTYAGAPRLPATWDAPDVCLICYDAGDEPLFDNPRVLCRCCVAVHASCWALVEDKRCLMCRKQYVPGSKKSAHASELAWMVVLLTFLGTLVMASAHMALPVYAGDVWLDVRFGTAPPGPAPDAAHHVVSVPLLLAQIDVHVPRFRPRHCDEPLMWHVFFDCVFSSGAACDVRTAYARAKACANHTQNP